MNKGKFIVFEGPDKAGKTTQIAKAQEYVRDVLGLECIITREPGGSPNAELIRDVVLHSGNKLDPITEVLLFAAARRDHLLKTIKPALEAGVVVLCDRYLPSTMAYQGVRYKQFMNETEGRETYDEISAYDDILKMHHEYTNYGIYIYPDAMLIYNVDPLYVAQRRADQKKDNFESRDGDYQKQVSNFYEQFIPVNEMSDLIRDMFEDYGVVDVHSIDADLSIEKVFQQTTAALIRILKPQTRYVHC